MHQLVRPARRVLTHVRAVHEQDVAVLSCGDHQRPTAAQRVWNDQNPSGTEIDVALEERRLIVRREIVCDGEIRLKLDDGVAIIAPAGRVRVEVPVSGGEVREACGIGGKPHASLPDPRRRNLARGRIGCRAEHSDASECYRAEAKHPAVIRRQMLVAVRSERDVHHPVEQQQAGSIQLPVRIEQDVTVTVIGVSGARHRSGNVGGRHSIGTRPYVERVEAIVERRDGSTHFLRLRHHVQRIRRAVEDRR